MVEERTRSHRWGDPATMAGLGGRMSGGEFLAAWKDGAIRPPMAATLGFELLDFGDGWVDIGCRPEEFHYNPYGMVHGGLAATLLDTATGCAVHSRLPEGVGYATVNLNVTYLRPVTVDSGQLRCRGSVSSMGRRVAVADAELVDGEGRRMAQATASLLLLAAGDG